MRSILVLLLLAFLVTSLPACDWPGQGPDVVVFDGVTYVSAGGAGLMGAGGTLIVRDDDTGGTYGTRVGLDGSFSMADFQVQPIDLEAGSGWGLKLFGGVDGTRTQVALAWNEAVDDSTHQVVFEYAPEVGASSVTLEYYLDGDLLYAVPGVPLRQGTAGPRTAGAGTSKGQPGSVHVIRDGSTYIVATDYNGGSPRLSPGGCSGALIQTGFVGLPTQFCTDFIQAVPDTFTLAEPATDLEIRGRAPLQQFTITSGTVQ